MDFSYGTCVLLILLPFVYGQAAPDAAAAAQPATNKVEVSHSAREVENANIGEAKMFTCTMEPAPADSDLLTNLKWYHGATELTTDGPVRVSAEMGNGMLMLTFDGVEESQAGNYTCTGTDGAQSDSKSFKLDPIKRMELTSPLEQFGILGEEGHIECVVGGNPAPIITWKDSNNQQIATGGRIIVTNDKLTIKDLTMDDEAVYACHAWQKAINNYKVNKINFEVVTKPTIPGPLTIEPQTAIIGQKVTITCSAEGDPAPTYTFKRGDVVFDESQVNGGIMTIEELHQEDEGEYTCIVQNKGGKDEKTYNLNVLVPPTIEMSETLQGVETQTASVECIARGDPAPSIKWTKGGDDLPSDVKPATETSEEIEGGNRHEVRSTLDVTLSYNHTGNWTCTATNSVGAPVSKDIRVLVEYAPRVPDNAAKFGWMGAKPMLMCNVTGNPLPTLQWYRPAQGDEGANVKIEADSIHTLSEPILDNANFRISQTLEVTIGEESQYGDYICEATNRHGSKAHTIDVKRAKKPSPVEVSLKEALTSVLKVKVKAPGNDGKNGPKISEYVVEYKGDDGETKSIESVQRSADEDMFELRELKSDTEYVVTVSGKSEAGVGKAVSVALRTLSTSKPVTLTVSGAPKETIQFTHYNLKWAEPDDGGSPITKFTVTWQEVKDADNLKPEGEEMKKELPGNAARSFDITNLEDGKTYLIKAIATNSIGNSTAATKIISIPSGDEAPLKTGESSSASLGGGVVAIIIIVIILVVIIVVVIFFVARKKPQLVERLRGRGNRGDEEGGAKEGGKDPAEEEKLIKKDDAVKVENEVDPRPPQEEAPQEFEPETKPEPVAVEVSAEPAVPVTDEVATLEPEVKVADPETPDVPEKAAEIPPNPTV